MSAYGSPLPPFDPQFTEDEAALMNRLTQLLAARRNRPPRPCIRQPSDQPMNQPKMMLIDNPELPSAQSLLVSAADDIESRANLRDQPTGERSMARTVAAFNAMYGQHLTEEQGWQFMALLKLARSTGGTFHLDDYTDQAAYSALAGECAARQQLTAPASGHTKPYATP